MKILVVDDDPHFREFMAHTLGKLDLCDVLFARDGDEAERILVDEPVDLVCLDFKLPGKDGRDVLNFIRARNTELPVLILSGLELANGLAQNDPWTRFAEKPQDLAELPGLLRSHFEEFEKL